MSAVPRGRPDLGDPLVRFALRVAGMRQAQATYFRERSNGALMKAKELERQVDEIISELLNPKLF